MSEVTDKVDDTVGQPPEGSRGDRPGPGTIPGSPPSYVLNIPLGLFRNNRHCGPAQIYRDQIFAFDRFPVEEPVQAPLVEFLSHH